MSQYEPPEVVWLLEPCAAEIPELPKDPEALDDPELAEDPELPDPGPPDTDVPEDVPEEPVPEAALEDPPDAAAELPVRARPSLQPVRKGSDSATVDLTAEDDTMALPRLDSLERKLKDLEQQFG